MSNSPSYLKQLESSIPELINRFVARAKYQLRGMKKEEPFEELAALTEDSSGLTLFASCALTYQYPYLDYLRGDATTIPPVDLADALRDLCHEGLDQLHAEVLFLGRKILDPGFHSRCVRLTLLLKGSPMAAVFVILGVTGNNVLAGVLRGADMSLALFLPFDEELKRQAHSKHDDRGVSEPSGTGPAEDAPAADRVSGAM